MHFAPQVHHQHTHLQFRSCNVTLDFEMHFRSKVTEGGERKWEERQKEGRRRWGNRGYKIPSWLLEKMMRSPENGQSREGAAFPHKDSSNLPHPVRAPGMEATLSLITRITNPSPPDSSWCRSPHVTPPHHQPTPPPPRLPCASPLPISVGVEMDGLCCCLQTVEGWTPNKVIKAERMALPRLAALILMDRGTIMTRRPHLGKLAVLTALLATYTGETLKTSPILLMVSHNYR